MAKSLLTYFPSTEGRDGVAACLHLAIKPLAEALRRHSNITGDKLGEVDHRLALHADDISLFLTDPAHSVPAILSTMNGLSYISGCKINLEKSEAGSKRSYTLIFPLRLVTFRIYLPWHKKSSDSLV